MFKKKKKIKQQTRRKKKQANITLSKIRIIWFIISGSQLFLLSSCLHSSRMFSISKGQGIQWILLREGKTRRENRGKKSAAHGLQHYSAESTASRFPAGAHCKHCTSQWSHVKRHHSTALSSELRVNKQEQIPNICENTSCYCLHMFKHFSRRHIWTTLPTHCHSLPPAPHTPYLFGPLSNQFKNE